MIEWMAETNKKLILFDREKLFFILIKKRIPKLNNLSIKKSVDGVWTNYA